MRILRTKAGFSVFAVEKRSGCFRPVPLIPLRAHVGHSTRDWCRRKADIRFTGRRPI